MNSPGVIFGLPAFFNRTYYESRFEKSKVQPNFWLRAFWDNAVAYHWNTVFEIQKPQVGWKKAMSLADTEKAKFVKTYDISFFAEPKELT